MENNERHLERKVHANLEDPREDIPCGEGQSDWLKKICECRADGFVQKPNRKTRTRHDNTDEMTSTSRSNNFGVLNFIERGLKDEVNAVDVMQEIVEITVHRGCGHTSGGREVLTPIEVWAARLSWVDDWHKRSR